MVTVTMALQHGSQRNLKQPEKMKNKSASKKLSGILILRKWAFRVHKMKTPLHMHPSAFSGPNTHLSNIDSFKSIRYLLLNMTDSDKRINILMTLCSVAREYHSINMGVILHP